MKRHVVGLILFALLAVSCGGSDDAAGDLAAVSGPAPAAGTCLADDPDCEDGADAGAAAPLPDAVSLGDPDSEGPLQITFGGFFYSDGDVHQLCSALAESFPPQCGSVVVDVVADLDLVLEHVAESFGDPDDASINIDSGIYWTDEWINLSGTLQADSLVLE